MGNITIAQINTALATTLGTAEGVVRTQDGANDGTADNTTTPLSDGMNDTPTLQVYFDEGETDAAYETDRTTFQAGVRQTGLTFLADVFVKQRESLGEDMARTLVLASAVWDVLEAQTVKPYFGLEGIQAFHWRAQRVILDYAGVSFIGIRFTLTIRVF